MIKLFGIGLGRLVYVNGVILNTNMDYYNWGFESSATLQLAVDLLQHHSNAPEGDVNRLAQALMAHILVKLPQQSFYVDFDIKGWVSDALANTLKAKESYLSFSNPDAQFDVRPAHVGMRVKHTPDVGG